MFVSLLIPNSDGDFTLEDRLEVGTNVRLNDPNLRLMIHCDPHPVTTFMPPYVFALREACDLEQGGRHDS